MRRSRYARLIRQEAGKRGSGQVRGKKGQWNEVGASLVEYALLLSLVAVVAVGALVYLGGSASNAVNNVAVAITTDPVITPDTSSIPATGGNCAPNLSFCFDYGWLDGMYFYLAPNGPWELIVAGAPSANQINDVHAFHLGTTSPHPWTCATTSGGVCTSIETNVVGTVPFALGTAS